MIEIRFTNNKLLGHAILDTDGFYYFEPNEDRGWWTAHGLNYVANKLDEINRPYLEILKNYEYTI